MPEKLPGGALQSYITYVGHATTLIEMDGLRLLTDPLLRNRISFLRRNSDSVHPEHYENIDAVLLSHLHHDHLDIPSLHKIGEDVLVVAPVGAGSFLHKKGLQNVIEVREDDVLKLGPVSLRVTYADHSPHRHPFGQSAACVGYVVEGSYSIYFPGDTALFEGMSSLSDSLDVALLPVWGWGPTLGAGHLDPRSAAEALRLLEPRLAIPIHWGTFHPLGMRFLSRQLQNTPPLEFAQHAAELMPGVQTRVVPPGHTLSVNTQLDP